MNLYVIDDESMDIMMIQRANSKLNQPFCVRCFSTTSDALNYFNASPTAPFGIILLDYNMPKIKGPDLIKAIRSLENTRKFPIIVWTGSANSEMMNQCYLNHVAGFIVKPFDYNELIDILKVIADYWFLNLTPISGEMEQVS